MNLNILRAVVNEAKETGCLYKGDKKEGYCKPGVCPLYNKKKVNGYGCRIIQLQEATDKLIEILQEMD